MVAKTAMFMVVQEQEGSHDSAAIKGKAEPTGYFRPVRSYSFESTYYVCLKYVIMTLKLRTRLSAFMITSIIPSGQDHLIDATNA